MKFGLLYCCVEDELSPGEGGLTLEDDFGAEMRVSWSLWKESLLQVWAN